MDDATLTTLRYTFQRILVPMVVVIGVLGNLVTVVVLTRRRMRCSTNVYLTALAVADIIYLLFIFVLSLEHYPNIHHSKYKLYWSTFGLSHWFVDASAYSSIYLTVSFTIERYIAVCHPIRGQVLCTESRAKRVIAAVVIICFILTVSTAFEYKLSQKMVYIDRTNQSVCKELTDIVEQNYTIPMLQQQQQLQQPLPQFNLQNNETSDIRNLTSPSTFVPLNDSKLLGNQINNCTMVYYIYADDSDFGQNEVYRKIFYILSSTFATFVPLILLATFNCFLVAAVHRSHKTRHKMTNTRQSDTSTAQENKITITLIAVVVLFLVCQTPGAIQLIYMMKVSKITNLDRALNNLWNFLVTLNAACNFLLYCALSDKYRKTVKDLFFGRRQNTAISSSRYVSGSTTASSVYCSKSPNCPRNSVVTGGGRINQNGQSPIATKSNAAKDKRAITNQFSISPEEYANLKNEIAKQQVISQKLRFGDRKNSSIPLVKVNAETDGSEQIPLNPNDVELNDAGESQTMSTTSSNGQQ